MGTLIGLDFAKAAIPILWHYRQECHRYPAPSRAARAVDSYSAVTRVGCRGFGFGHLAVDVERRVPNVHSLENTEASADVTSRLVDARWEPDAGSTSLLGTHIVNEDSGATPCAYVCRDAVGSDSNALQRVSAVSGLVDVDGFAGAIRRGSDDCRLRLGVDRGCCPTMPPAAAQCVTRSHTWQVTSRMDIINLRSDTQTLPTEAMLQAMASAPLGDDVFGEDPTVNRLEEMAARMLGKEAAMLVISGTMGNLVSLMAHASPGDEVLIDPEAHIFYYEAGGIASVAGLMPMPVRSSDGVLDPADVRAAIRRQPNVHFPTPKLLCLENTHNRSGGRVVPLDLQNELCAVAHDHGLAVHLDGARIFNASIAAGVPAAEYARGVDSLMFCLSKGLSCPLGSVVVGSAEFIEKARRCRKRVGGGMRQAGVIAAAGIVALERMVDRLREDHEAAVLLARGIVDVPGLEVDLDKMETNMVYVDHSGTGMSTSEALERLAAEGVMASGAPPNRFRMVTSRHATPEVVKEAVVRIRQAFSR